MSFVLDDSKVFTGDALLIRGCGRTDFQEGSSEQLHASVNEKLFPLGDAVEVYPGHDYRGQRVSTIGEERAHNPRLGRGTTVAEFTAIMDALQLPPPKKLAEALPANLSCGRVQQAADEPLIHHAELDHAALEGLGAHNVDGIYQVDADWLRGPGRNRRVRVLDVRSVDEFHSELEPGPGAELVPFETLAMRAESWDRDAPLVVTCRSGRRSEAAARLLMRRGFTQVMNLAGGLIQAERSAA